MSGLIVRFTVPGPPMGKQRPRVYRVGDKSRAVTPQKTVSYENLVKWYYSSEAGEKRLEGEIEACIKAMYPIPKSMSKKNRQLIEEDKLHPTKKPDADNIGKIILDSINGLAYHDDSQVVRLVIEKYYSEFPRVEVALREII